jgi:hypothetical protein
MSVKRLCLAPAVFVALVALSACCKKEWSGRQGPEGGSPTAAEKAPDQGKLEAAIGRLDTSSASSAEDELVAMGAGATPRLASYMLAQDAKIQKAPPSKQFDLTKPLLRAMNACKRIGPDGKPPLLLLHKTTKSSGIRTLSCMSLKQLGSNCPAGER